MSNESMKTGFENCSNPAILNALILNYQITERRYEAALNQIAAWGDGRAQLDLEALSMDENLGVTGSFDEPGAAKVARNALLEPFL